MAQEQKPLYYMLHFDCRSHCGHRYHTQGDWVATRYDNNNLLYIIK